MRQFQLMQQIEPEEERGYESTQIPPVDEIDERNRFDRWSIESKPMSSQYVIEMKSKYGIRDGLWLADELVQAVKIFSGNKTYEIEYQSPQLQFDDLLPTVEQMISSFKILPMPPLQLCKGR